MIYLWVHAIAFRCIGQKNKPKSLYNIWKCLNLMAIQFCETSCTTIVDFNALRTLLGCIYMSAKVVAMICIAPGLPSDGKFIILKRVSQIGRHQNKQQEGSKNIQLAHTVLTFTSLDLYNLSKRLFKHYLLHLLWLGRPYLIPKRSSLSWKQN